MRFSDPRLSPIHRTLGLLLALFSRLFFAGAEVERERKSSGIIDEVSTLPEPEASLTCKACVPEKFATSEGVGFGERGEERAGRGLVAACVWTGLILGTPCTSGGTSERRKMLSRK